MIKMEYIPVNDKIAILKPPSCENDREKNESKKHWITAYDKNGNIYHYLAPYGNYRKKHRYNHLYRYMHSQ